MRPVQIVQVGDLIIVEAAALGFPRGLFPKRIRMRDENRRPHWFTRESIDAQGAVYKAGKLTLTVKTELGGQ